MMTEWQLGLRAFREGRMREASDRLSAAARDAEKTVTQGVRFQTLTFLGAALYALGQPADAVKAFEDALRLTPTPVVPAALTVNVANAYLAVGRRSDARRALEQTLQSAPGHVEARMMLQRLENTPENAPLQGKILGETPEGVMNYIRTLTFSTVASGGYDQEQVRQALLQVERYINFLISMLNARNETIARQEVDMERYRKMEDDYIEKMMQDNKEHDRKQEESIRPVGQPVETAPENTAQPALTPIEILFQKKG
jgi:DivIVA domain-containing protein